MISLDDLRSRMPELRTRETTLRQQIDALDTQLADREVYLTLADNLEDFLTRLRGNAATATIAERQRVLRLLVKDVHISPDKITIRHSIPIRHIPTSTTESSPDTDSEGETRPDCQLRWRSQDATLRRAGQGVVLVAEFGEDPGLKERLHQRHDPFVFDSPAHPIHQG